MSTLAAQSRSSVGFSVLAEITAGLWARAWVATSGKSITYEIATALDVTAVNEDGSALTERSSVNDVDSNAGSFYHDGATLYVSATTGTPFGKVIIATISFRFARSPKIFSHQLYESRIDRAPNLSLRIEKEFGGVGQVGGGDLRLTNHDGYFDSLATLQWDYGTVTIKVGFDLPGAEMAYGSYSTVGTWKVKYWQPDDGFLTLRLEEIKGRLKKKIPLEVYNKTDHPQVAEKYLGKPVPRAYGRIYGVEPALVDASTSTFKVAGHAIMSFDAVRVKVDGVWTDSTFASTDLANAECTVTGWEAGQDVSIDFSGRKTGSELMTNFADIVEDLLTYLGETDINSTDLAAARARLDIGDDRFGKEHHARAISLYVNDLQEAVKWLSELTATAGGYVFSDANGQYHVGVFEPSVGEGLTVFTEADFEKFEPLLDTDRNASEILIRYNERETDGWKETESFTSESSRLTHGEPAHVILDDEPSLFRRSDILYHGQRLIQMRGQPLQTWRLVTYWNAITIVPGDQVRVTYTRRSFDEILEVLEVAADLTTGKVTLVLGNLRAYARHSGFWVNDAATLPSRFASLAGYGSGSLTWNASWASLIKQWAKQNVGYWTDANGFASTSDPESFIPSKWI